MRKIQTKKLKKLKALNPNELSSAHKKIQRAAIKRKQRKTLFPAGFEYQTRRK
jgi:hypothetical protein